MRCIPFNVAEFRAQFPALFCGSVITDATLQRYFDVATLYISDRAGGAYCGGMNTGQQTYALYLMTAHLAAISQAIGAGNTPGIVTGATIDKVTVTLEPPPVANQWQYWLQSTPYGQELLSLLQLAAVGGIYASTAAPGRAGFRFSGVW